MQIEKEAGDENTFARNGKPYPWIEGVFFESNEKAAEYLGTSVKRTYCIFKEKTGSGVRQFKSVALERRAYYHEKPKAISDKNTLLYFEN